MPQDILNQNERKKEYEEKGYTVFRNVIDSALIKEVNQHLEFLSKKFSNLRPEHYHHPLIRDDAFWVRLVTDNRLLNIAQLFLGKNIANFTAHYICKPPYDGQAVLWHQDGAYWNLQPMKAATLWLAIDHSNPDNGCLRVIPGSHHLPLQELKLDDSEPNMLFSGIDYEIDTSKAVDIILQPGDVSVHNPFIIHGSKANKSPNRRCGLDMGFIETSTKVGNKDLYMYPILARGKSVPGINNYRQWPQYDKDKTIYFAGCEQWNDYIIDKNKYFVPNENDEDVLTVTERMISRLKNGTTSL
jgi:phytanoyl-CoA hydroxylase